MTFKKFPQPKDYSHKEKAWIIATLLWRVDTKQKLQKLFDTIPLDYQKIKDGYWEFYVLGTRNEWINWISKFEELLEALK